jgi:hypothetical protein
MQWRQKRPVTAFVPQVHVERRMLPASLFFFNRFGDGKSRIDFTAGFGFIGINGQAGSGNRNHGIGWLPFLPAGGDIILHWSD